MWPRFTSVFWTLTWDSLAGGRSVPSVGKGRNACTTYLAPREPIAAETPLTKPLSLPDKQAVRCSLLLCDLCVSFGTFK
jgi:hypothetical protein